MFVKFVPLAVASTLLAAGGCGGGAADEPSVQGPPPAPADPAFDKIKPTIARACGRCHNGVKHPLNFLAPGVFKGSNAKARIEAGTMPPPPATLTEIDKADLLGYLGS